MAEKPPVADPVMPPKEEAPPAPSDPKVSNPPAKEEAPKAEPKAEGKEEQPPTPKKVVPEKYDLKVADDSVLDALAVEKIAAYAKEQGLSQQEAQELLEGEAEAVAKERKELSERYLKASKEDKEIGGEAFQQSVEVGLKAVERFGSPALRKILDQSGYGNHPEWIRFVSKIGKAMKDDKFISAPAPSGKEGKSIVDKFYPKG